MASLAALGLAACSSDPRAPEHVTVELQTDFEPGAELAAVRVEVLQNFGDALLDVGWLAVAESCVADADGHYTLGSFQVETGGQRNVRVRATGYALRGDVHTPLAENQVSVPTGKDGAFSLMLHARCVDRFCDESTTCNPETEKCESTPEAALLERSARHDACASARKDAPALVAEPAYASACEQGDESCRQEARSCAAHCEEPCSRCDLPGFEGQCTEVDFSRSDDIEHCGACGASCGDAQAFGAECVHGACVYTCRPGFDDCNADVNGHDGCELDVREDRNNCGRCGIQCEYAPCYDGMCPKLYGTATGASVLSLDGTETWTFPITIARATTLVGLGGLLASTSRPAARVRFGLYEEDAFHRPLYLVAQTAPVEVVDYSPALPLADTLTYASVAPIELGPATYYLAVRPEKAVLLYAEPASLDLGLPAYTFESDGIGTYDKTVRATITMTRQPQASLVLLQANPEI